MAKPTWKLWATGAVIALYSLALTHWGIFTNFVGDDVVNIAFLHGYGHKTLGVILTEALSIFTPAYRPVGGLYYRSLFALVGFHPFSFRVVFFTLLAVNTALALVWYKQLTHSLLAAGCAALFFSFHPALASLYYANGTIYDVLCVLFVLLGLIQYVNIRQSNRFLTGNHLPSRLCFMAGLWGARKWR